VFLLGCGFEAKKMLINKLVAVLYIPLLYVALCLIWPLFFPKAKNVLAVFFSIFSLLALAELWSVFSLPFPAGSFDTYFVFEGVGKFFASLVLFIGAFIGLYSYSYMKQEHSLTKFYFALGLFQFSMLGLSFVEHWLALVVFWELSSVSSFLLISHNRESTESQKGAFRALLTTAFGGFALLISALLCWKLSGSWALSGLADLTAFMHAGEYSLEISIVFFGVFFAVLTKSAQFPFHFWLPGAMAAPTPVSAYLHSATLVKAGILLLFKLAPYLSAWPLWELFIPVGALTYLFAGLVALTKDDLKGLLAYSTIAQLALIILCLGVGSPVAMWAAAFHVTSHAIFKASLFMMVGIVDHGAHTRKISILHGLGRKSKLLALCTAIAGLAMAGVPFLVGFVSKEMLLTTLLKSSSYGVLLCVIVAAGAICTTAYVLRLVWEIFWKKNSKPSFQFEQPTLFSVLVPFALSCFCILGGLYPASIEVFLANCFESVDGVLPIKAHVLPAWHLEFQLSLAALLLGFGLYKIRKPFEQLIKGLSFFELKSLFDFSFAKMIRLGELASNLVQNNRSSSFLISSVLVGVSVFVFFLPFDLLLNFKFSIFEHSELLSFNDLFVFVGTCILLVLLVLTMVFVNFERRWNDVILLGATGSCLVLLFYLLGAPDLALTQATVEVLSLAFMAITLLYSRRESVDRAKKAQAWKVFASQSWRIGAIAIVSIVSFVATLFVLLAPISSRVAASYYGQVTKLLAGGRNVVNVILVDFRGFDTLGEIVVFSAAALCFAALRSDLSFEKLDKLALYKKTESSWMRNWFVVFAYLLFVMALYFLFRGHYEPGGGFVGGLLIAVAVLLIRFYWPQAYVSLKPFPRGVYWVLLGLALAVAAVALPVFIDGKVFQSYIVSGFASSSLFDFALAMLVAGVALELVQAPNEDFLYD